MAHRVLQFKISLWEKNCLMSRTQIHYYHESSKCACVPGSRNLSFTYLVGVVKGNYSHVEQDVFAEAEPDGRQLWGGVTHGWPLHTDGCTGCTLITVHERLSPDNSRVVFAVEVTHVNIICLESLNSGMFRFFSELNFQKANCMEEYLDFCMWYFWV